MTEVYICIVGRGKQDWGVTSEDKEGYDLPSSNNRELYMCIVGQGKRDRGTPGADEEDHDLPSSSNDWVVHVYCRSR